MNIIVLADSDIQSSSEAAKLESVARDGDSVRFVLLYKSCDEKKSGNMLMKVDNVLKTKALNRAKKVASSIGLNGDTDIQALCPCKLKFYMKKNDIDGVLDFQKVPLLSKNDILELDVEYL